jgi:FkbM family methyltransferase
MSLAGELRKIADRLSIPEAGEAKRLRVPLSQFLLFRRVQALADVRTVLDVGANTGEFARWCAICFPRARIHAFEPLEVCQPALQAAAASHNNLNVHAKALGEECDRTTMFQNDFSPSSSLLPMQDRHREIWPKTRSDKPVEIEVQTLDSFASDNPLEEAIFLKMDVQGFEMHVLRGAAATLPRLSVIMCEVLFEGLYEGQADFREMLNFLAERGFRFLEFADERRLAPHNQMVYADAVFVRDDLRYPA